MLNIAKATPETNKYDEYTHDKHEFEKNKWEEQFTVSKPRITAQLDIVTQKHFKNKSWSALFGRATQGRNLTLSAHKDLPLPATTP